jgi:hypothetical protein
LAFDVSSGEFTGGNVFETGGWALQPLRHAGGIVVGGKGVFDAGGGKQSDVGISVEIFTGITVFDVDSGDGRDWELGW